MRSSGTTTATPVHVINKHGPSVSSPIQGSSIQGPETIATTSTRSTISTASSAPSSQDDHCISSASSTPQPPPQPPLSLDLDSTTISLASQDQDATTLTTTTTTAAGSPSRPPGPHQQTFNVVESGSPVKHQSPLRQFISYHDQLDLESPTLSFRGSIEFANSIIGRSNMSYTGDKKHTRRVSSDRVPVWKQGQVQDVPSLSSSTHSTPTRQVKTKVAAAAAEPTTPKSAASPTGSSRFAFFSSSISALKGSVASSPPPVAVPNDDELMNLDIHSALFPGSHQHDTFSPAAYKNLQMTATGLLQKFQTAYQQRTIAYHELKAESAAQAEEQDEAETRMHHLKMQLEGMARRAAEQEAIMQSLMAELTQEKQARMGERQMSREKGTSVSEGSSLSEDLGVEEDQQRNAWRRSAGTLKSDMGCETDDESSFEEASVFSRSRSPTIATTVAEMSHHERPPPPLPATQVKTPTLGTPRNPPARSTGQPQMSAFQKLFKGISSDSPKEANTTSSCGNCEGQSVSVAWDTVSLLKDENKGLKARVSELEIAVEGALDVANGVAVRAL